MKKTDYCIYAYNLYTSAVKQDAIVSRLKSSRVKRTSSQSLRNGFFLFMTAFVATFIFTNYKAIDTFQKHFLPCCLKTHTFLLAVETLRRTRAANVLRCIGLTSNMEAKKHDG